MEPNSNDQLVSDRPLQSLDDSDDKPEATPNRAFPKNKPIKKNLKSRPKESDPPSISTFNQTELQVSMAPFGIFQSQTQKCQRLDLYFRKDISQYYKTKIDDADLQTLHSMRDNNLIQLEDCMKQDLKEIWGDKMTSLPEISSYLQLILDIKYSNSNYFIFSDQLARKTFCCFHIQNSKKIIEINDLEFKILQNRRFFMQQFQNYKQNYKGTAQQKHIKELNMEIIFFYKMLYEETKKLNQSIHYIEQNIPKTLQMDFEIDLSQKVETDYTKYLTRKLIQNSLRNTDVDYLNYFRDNQILEHHNGPVQNRFTQLKEYEDFIKKKKNKRGRKAKYPLHTACTGCMSAYYQQYNPISFCHQCYVRFHKTCYSGFKEETSPFNKEEKDSLCETCYNKKLNPNAKSRHNQCDYCNSKGVLHIPAGPNRRIHVFCMLVNGLWTVKNNKVQFSSHQTKIPSNSDLKCTKCNSGNGYVYFCQKCQKIAHPLCAFLGGWDVSVTFVEEETNKVNITMQCCCGVQLAENQKRRKFMTNFKRQAYNL